MDRDNKEPWDGHKFELRMELKGPKDKNNSLHISITIITLTSKSAKSTFSLKSPTLPAELDQEIYYNQKNRHISTCRYFKGMGKQQKARAEQIASY